MQRTTSRITVWTAAVLVIALQFLFVGQAQASTIEERMVNRRTNFASQVTSERLAKLQDSCEGAQLKLGGISTRVADQHRRRDVAYTDLLDHLTELDTKLTNQQIRHTTYTRELGRLTTNWRNFEQAAERYNVALADARSLDCATDPEGFLLTLADARAAQVTVLEAHDSYMSSLRAVKTELNYLAPLLSQINGFLLASLVVGGTA